MAATDSRGDRPLADLARVDVVFGHLRGAVGALGERDARGACRLPGWTRGHVLTHLARNADGQRHLVEGVLVDEVRDQYPGGDEQRRRDIEAGAGRPIAELLADLVASQRALVDAWSQVPDGAWDRLDSRPGGYASGAGRGDLAFGARSPCTWSISTSGSAPTSCRRTTSSSTPSGSRCTAPSGDGTQRLQRTLTAAREGRDGEGRH